MIYLRSIVTAYCASRIEQACKKITLNITHLSTDNHGENRYPKLVLHVRFPRTFTKNKTDSTTESASTSEHAI